MSNNLKVLNGKEVIKIFEQYGFIQVRSKGSHVRLACYRDNAKHLITIPLHTELKRGTLYSIAKEFGLIFGNDAMKKEMYNT